MKVRNITILVKGEKEFRTMTRKEFMEFIDNEVLEETSIQIIKLDY